MSDKPGIFTKLVSHLYVTVSPGAKVETPLRSGVALGKSGGRPQSPGEGQAHCIQFTATLASQGCRANQGGTDRP